MSLDKDGALAAASSVDVALAEEKELPMLAGVPMAIKDNILIEGLPATAASKILKDYKASYDATVIQKLKETKAIFLGKTNLDEFACGSSTENSGFQITKNPHDLERVPGGSSGGSAAAVAGHTAIAALGTDTGGSIREPASFCGVVGLKPTYGAVSRYGAIALASSLDQIGPLTKTVEDAAILFDTIRGKDMFDATSVDQKYGDELLNPKLEDVKNLTIGLPKEYFVSGLSKEVEDGLQKTIESLKSLGIKFKEVSLPHSKYALSVYYIIMPAELSSNLARYDGIRYNRNESRKHAKSNAESRGNSDSDLSPERSRRQTELQELYFQTRGNGFGDEVRRRIMLGTYVLSSGYYDAYYTKAQKARRLIKEDFVKAFEEVDVILGPVVPTPAFKIGEKTDDPLQMYLSDIFTIPVNLAGLPAISIPVSQMSKVKSQMFGLPVGFQLIGKHFRESDILGVGQFYERITNF